MFVGAFTPISFPLSWDSWVMCELGMTKSVCAPCCITEPSETTSSDSCCCATASM